MAELSCLCTVCRGTITSSIWSSSLQVSWLYTVGWVIITFSSCSSSFESLESITAVFWRWQGFSQLKWTTTQCWHLLLGCRCSDKETSCVHLAERDFFHNVLITGEVNQVCLLGAYFLTTHGIIIDLKEPEGQVAPWLEQIQEFDFHTEHQAGKYHNDADALPRIPHDVKHTTSVIPTCALLTGTTGVIHNWPQHNEDRKYGRSKKILSLKQWWTGWKNQKRDLLMLLLLAQIKPLDQSRPTGAN